MAKHDSLAIDRDFSEIAEPRKLLGQFSRILVVIARHGEYLFAPNFASQFERTSFWTDAEVTEKIEHVVRFEASWSPGSNSQRIYRVISGSRHHAERGALTYWDAF